MNRAGIWTGSNVTLRAMEPGDISLFEAFDDEYAKSMDVLMLPQSSSRLRSWFERELQGKLNDEFRFIAVDRSGQPVGTIDTFACNRRNRTFKYGVAVARDHWGKGYAGEMIVLVLRFYFLELGYEKVTPHVYSFNERSLRLHDRLGFVREGRLRNMVIVNGQYYDEIHFGMTRAEFTEWHN